MDKQGLRKIFLEKRKKLTNKELDNYSNLIINHFTENFDLKYKKICCFLPIKSKNEINTYKLLEKSSILGFEFCATKWNILTNDLLIYSINPQSKLVTSKFDIPEPSSNEIEVSSSDIDLVLIPLLIFDKVGHRVGYGKGVYDQFLKKFNQKKTRFIGLSLFEGVDKIDDINVNDIKLTHCITPLNVITF